MVVKRSTPDVVSAIAGAIAPYLGETMALSATEAHRAKLGLDASALEPAQVEVLVQRVGLGLNIFVGRDKTAEVVAAMRHAVDQVPAS